MIKKIGAGVAVFVVAFVAIIATRPDTYEVERSAVINAKADTVFALTGDLKALETWSPWAEGDPTQKVTYTGDTAAVGGSSSWKGEKTGEGTQTVAEREENKKLVTDLVFKTPMEGKGRAALLLSPEGDGTRVTWTMKGDQNFMGKAFSLFMSMDGMIGGQYEKGLAKLKTKAEDAQKEADAKAAQKEAEANAAAAEGGDAAEGDGAQGGGDAKDGAGEPKEDAKKEG
jgi:hypothetical protein